MPPKKSAVSTPPSGRSAASTPIRSFDNILVYYGHGAMLVKNRKTETFVVPSGRCIVTIVDVGDEAWAAQQEAFHQLCKLAMAKSASGRTAHTWLSNPIVYKAEIEKQIDRFAAKVFGTTQLHIAYGDFEEEDLRTTPKFFGQSYLNDTAEIKQNDGTTLYEIDICKSGLYFLEDAGDGDYHVVKHESDTGMVTEDEVLSAYVGSVFPTLDDIMEAKIKSQEEEPEVWAEDSTFHTEWKYTINHNDNLHIGRNKVLELLNEKEGRGVFYNLACRVVMDQQVVGARTRSIVGAVAELEAAASAAVAPHVVAVSGKSAVAKRQARENAAAATAAAEAEAAAAANKLQMEIEEAGKLGISVAIYRKWFNMLKNGDDGDDEVADAYLAKEMEKAKKGRRGGTRRPYKGDNRRTRKRHG